ncbi:MAG TPA: trimethylamine methyltransferase family protein [Firmicutes bacterium]|nr:trimethylamine methyltransferase family protein [Bacillota bacterium]
MRRNISCGRGLLSGFSLNVFSEEECERIHLATLELLETTGVFCESERAIEIFEAGGCRVDHEKKIVKIPAWLVEDSVRKAPPRVLMAGRDPKNDVVLESGRVNFLTFGQGIMVIDPYTGERRPSVKKDIADVARLVDALPNVDVIEDTLYASDKDERVAMLHNTEATLSNTTKHQSQGADSAHQAKLAIEMAAAIVGGKDKLKDRPIISGGGCPVSPLTLPEGNTEQLIEYASVGLPCNPLSMAMAGGSTPVTLAGTLTVHNAEILSYIVMIQLVNPGNPCTYGSSTTAMDLRRAIATVGCPELGMISAAVAKMAQFYKIPSFVAGT